MATIFSHPAVALGLAPWFADIRTSKTILVTGIIFTALPDIDVIGLHAGIPYDHMLGHRGLTHSLLFAAASSAIMTWLFSIRMKFQRAAVGIYLFLSMSSHGLLDALTNGGLGIAFFAPFSSQRYFLPWQPIEVSTLDIAYFFAGQGLPVLLSELLYLWPACIAIFVIGYWWNKQKGPA